MVESIKQILMRRDGMSADEAEASIDAVQSEASTTLTPKQREAIYEAWIAALRSGQCKQGQNYLEADGKFCCLGVLCHVLCKRPELGIEMDRLVLDDGTAVYSTPTSQGCRSKTKVPGSIASELGLSTTMPSVLHRAVEVVLMDLNDRNGASFAEIAQFIEGSVMPLLRIKGILPPAQQEAPEKDHETHENTTDAPLMEERVQRDEALLRQALEALIWARGSEDFGEGGLAREGALKLLFPAIAALRERLGDKA